MPPSPLVSVVIPTYYRNERLEKAIKSVKNQTYPNIEVIVVDGTGESYAELVTSNYDCKFIAQDQDHGPHAARSEGAIASTGDYIQFLDDDDQIHPEKIEKQVAFLEKNPKVGVVYCGIEYEKGETKYPDPAIRGNILESALSTYTSSAYTSALLIRAKVLTEILPLSNRHGADDIGMRIELAQRTEFDFVDEVLVTLGQPNYSLGTTWDHIEGRWKILEKYDDLYSAAPSDCRKIAMAAIYERTGRRILEEQVWSPYAIYCFARALQLSPKVNLHQIGEFITSVGGKPSRQLAKRIIRRFNFL